jgi:hypothetical protein
MAENCDNACGNFNVGLSQCAYKIPAMAGFMFVKKYGSGGTLNGIPTNATLTQSALDARINSADSDNRFYPVFKTNGYGLNGITPTVADPPTVATDFGGTIDVLPRGLTTWEFTAFYTNPAWNEGLRRLLSCGDWTAYRIDLNGYWHGILSEDGETLYGFDIESFRAKFNWPTATTLANSLISFSDSISNDPLNAYYFSNITANTLASKGLVDVTGTLATAGATTQTVTLVSNTYNAMGAEFEGLVMADFEVIKTSDGTNITIASVVETSSGVYLITTTGSTGLSAHIEITKAGYDFSSVSSQTFTYA